MYVNKDNLTESPICEISFTFDSILLIHCLSSFVQISRVLRQ